MKKTHFVRTLIFAGSLLLQLGAFSFHCHAAAGDVDLSFDPGAGVPGQVHGAALQTDGKVIVGGELGIARLNADGGDDRSFQRVRGLSYASPLAVLPDGKVVIGHALGVARLNVDGSVDTSFTATINYGYYEENDGVFAAALQSDGKLLIGGSFGLVNGIFRGGFARLNGDGSIDSGFAPAVSGRVSAVALQPDGKVLIGGHLSTPTGHKSLLRFNADGSLDESFATPSNPNDSVFSLAVQADGRIIAGGYFSIGGHNHIVRLTANGEVDSAFNADATANDTVLSVRLQSDGKILVAGGFTEMNGTPRDALARLHADGSLDDSYNPTTNFGPDFTFHPRIFSMLVLPDRKLLITGNFTEIGGVIRAGLARLESDGTLDGSFNPGGGVSGPVYSLRVQPDGKVLLSGSFKSINGLSRNGIARLNPDGSLDTAVFDRGIAGSSGPVAAVAIQPDGKVLIGTENGLVRVHADGTLDAGFTAAISTGDDTTAVTSLAVQSDGKILVGGYGRTLVLDDPVEGGFSYWYRLHLTRLNPDGSYDASFERTLGESIPNDLYTVSALAVQPDGKVVVAGYFFTFKGTSHVGIARVNPDGTLDTGFSVGANSSVSALALQADGRLLIGGGFTEVGGTSRRRIARLNADGSLDTSYDPGTGADNAVAAIALQSDGKLLLAGYFNTINGTSRQRIARLNADGSLDEGFIAFPEPDYVYTVALQADGKVLMGGSFHSVRGVASPAVARLYGDPVPFLTVARSGHTVIVSWPSSATGFVLQHSADLNPGTWTTPTETITDNGTTKFITVSLAPGSRFFRLFKP